MKVVIGLGNPEPKYINTRHNIGHRVVHQFLRKAGLNLERNLKCNAQLAKFQNNLIGVTEEYMNNSGFSVRKIIDYYKIDPKDLYLVHDDLDLPVGDWKLQFERGAAGHNGVISTIEQLGTQAFWRYRIGIDHPHNDIPVESYVLQTFNPEEKVIIDRIVDTMVSELNTLFSS